ncbi:MAG: DNA polymerase III subunit gamma/tau, partial [Myxococcales bacterium]
MSYLVLARKYRPNSFEEIIGQEHATRTLTNAIKQGKIHHAFLFTGTRGVGKTTTARVLAKALCCQSFPEPTPTPCGTCDSCTAIGRGSDIDVNEIDGASNNSVNDVRDLRDNVQYRPQRARFKIYIIDEVHMLTGAAFNALLKTLEEPPPHVKFIFATTEAHKIPATILSRCQRYDFKAVSAKEIAQLIGKLLAKEGVSISEAALRMVARKARGSVRDGLSLIDSVLAYAGETIAEDDVRMVLGMADASVFERLGGALVRRDAPAAFDAVADLVDYGHDLRQFGAEFLEYLRDAAMVSSHPGAAASLDRPEAETRELADLAKGAETAEWIAWFDLMVEGQERIARSEQARFMLELTLAKMLQVGRLRPIEDLLAGLNRLAKGGAAAGAPAASAGL